MPYEDVVSNYKSFGGATKQHPIACISLCCVSIFANATDLPIKKGMPFLSTRTALIKNGWKSNITNETELVGTEVSLRNRGALEIERCTEGVQYCEFNYIKNKNCLGVGTVGEEIKDMKIYSWNFEYPKMD